MEDEAVGHQVVVYNSLPLLIVSSGAHLVKRWSALASRSEPADQA
jgi:hypothetical protein